MSRSADEPQFHVFENAARPGLVHLAIGTGTDGYNVTPELAEQLADKLGEAAALARTAGRGVKT
jgi:hypothetical protein